jgi:hypothetical protein
MTRSVPVLAPVPEQNETNNPQNNDPPPPGDDPSSDPSDPDYDPYDEPDPWDEISTDEEYVDMLERMADVNRFAITTAAASDRPHDVTTKVGSKTISEGAAKFDNVEIDLDNANMFVMIDAVNNRAIAYGWFKSILTIPRNVDEPEPEEDRLNLLYNHGEITMRHLRTVFDRYQLNSERALQDSHMLYQCLKSSMTKEANARILLHVNEYLHKGHFVGILLLKVILRETHIDNNATAKYVRLAISKLPTTMVEYSYDVDKFNDYVRGLVTTLSQRGMKSDDLMTNLFEAYAEVKDTEFVRFMKNIEDQYELKLKDIKYEELMDNAQNKYRAMKQSGKWMATSAEQVRISALEAQIKNITKKKSPTQGNTSTKASGTTTTGTSTKKKGAKPDWMMKPPKEGAAKSKTVEGKKYHWCPNHASWTIHHPNDCKGKGHMPEKKQKKTPETSDEESKRKAENQDDKDKKKKAKLVQALTATQGSISDSEE